MAERFHCDMLLAGSGGQGMMTAGRLLAGALMDVGYDVTFFPTYGAEVRGGTAHCHVRTADRAIPSPMVEDADLLVVMNEPSYRKFSPLLHRGSRLIVNTSLVPRDAVGRHNGCQVLGVDLTEIAESMGSLRSANMLVVGLTAALLGVVPLKPLQTRVTDLLGAKSPALLDTNLRILERGYELTNGQ